LFSAIRLIAFMLDTLQNFGVQRFGALISANACYGLFPVPMFFDVVFTVTCLSGARIGQGNLIEGLRAGKPKRLFHRPEPHKLLTQDSPRMDRGQLGRLHILLMVVHNLNVERILALPAKANPPLVIDADAVLSLPVTFQCFQVVAIWHA
jgi:hypothetical protein